MPAEFKEWLAEQGIIPWDFFLARQR